MGRWVRPEMYPLLGAMGFVTSMVVFQLTRNALLNPDCRINKANRKMGILENEDEGEKYAQHNLRKYLRTRQPQVMPSLNRFFSHDHS
ncbi:hypothetical protein EUTSA_v10005671mg [Eutrema salsugineum]|uniref:NADH-ubiquinone reductase complex 1 MLRQ subunit n=1 Tax=Eutrema salsugineum TaxID=72664 RepID=V4KYP0_EUTSA|nr:uncharacterized protein LOC18013096 [Eutrema salsugineum]ESQ32548.1 hypothetical protein EUTSA_v10005671mg [Eutrema salsugineum]